MRRSTQIVALLAVSLTLAGCSSSGKVEEKSPAKSTQVAAQPAPSPTPTPKSPQLILISCIGGSLAKATLDLGTKQVSPSNVPSAPCATSFQSLSPDGSKVTFSVRNSEDNSNHVGWVDITSGKRVDVTQSLSSSASAMAAVRQDGNPVFSPQGDFVFQDRNAKTVDFVSTTDGSVKSAVNSMEGFDNELYVGPDNSLSGMDNRDFAFAFPIPGAPGSKFCDMKRNRAQVFPGDGTAVLSNLTVVQSNSQNTGSGCNGTTLVRTLVPKSDFILRGAVFEPASKTIFFGAVRGTQYFLFSVPLDGSSQPIQVADLSSLGVAYSPVAIATP